MPEDDTANKEAAAREDSSSESDAEEGKAPKEVSAQDAELEAAIAAIRATKDLPRPPYPTLPNLNAPGSMQSKVNAVQTRAGARSNPGRPPLAQGRYTRAPHRTLAVAQVH